MIRKLPFQFFSSFLLVGLFVLACLFFVVSCKKAEHDGTELVSYQKAVVMKVSDLRAQTYVVGKARDIKRSGKIYIYEDYLFVSEPNNGIHILDNRNPGWPVRVGFISIPGNNDIAVRNNVLYADNYVDLLAFDIRRPSEARLLKRLEDVFPQFYSNKAKGEFVGYRDTVVRQQVFSGGTFFAFESFSTALAGTAKSGTGGSMARFTLLNDYLYTVSASDLRLFNVSKAAEPVYVKNLALGWGVETIFPYGNNLFIGSSNGMHILDASVADNPVKLSTYSHFTSCDPVVVKGNLAFCTLRSGAMCRLGMNVLDVIDISDLKKPTLLRSYPMKNPHGLSVSGNDLFLCEGDYGLKLLNIANAGDITTLNWFMQMTATDVIVGPRSVIVIGKGGLYQFSRLGTRNLHLLSKIPVKDPTAAQY